MQKIKEKLFLGIIFYLSIVALGHLMHGSGDAIRRMAMTRSIIFEGSVITSKYGAIRYAPLQSFAMIPQYGLGYLVGKTLGFPEKKRLRIAYRFCMYFFNPLIIAVICVLYFNFLGKLGFELPEKLFSTYTMLFGTLLLPYSKWLWSEPLSALLILSSFYCLYCSIEGKFRKYNFLNFLFLGLLCLNGLVFNILFLTMFLFVFYYFYFIDKNCQNNKILFIDASIIFCICSSLVLYYNYSRYGDIFNMGFSSFRLEDHDNSRYAGTFNRPVLEGLYSLFFSIGKGIMIYSPITFLLPFVFIFFYHQIKARISYCLCTLMVSYILLLILYSKWGIGVWVWGTRYMLPFFPALHLLFPFLLINAKKANPLTKSFLLIVVFWAIGINAFEFIGAWPHFQYDTFFKTETPYSFGMYLPWLSPLFNNWSNWWPNGLIRLIQFVSVAWTTFYIVVIWYQKKFPTA